VIEPVRADLRTDGTELRFPRLLQNAHDLIYRFRVAAPRGYDYINAACLAITGHRPEEFYANPNLILSIVHPDDVPLVLEAFQEDPEKMQRAITVRWIHPDGTTVHAEHRRVPILDRDGRLVAIEGVGRDVTERVETQRQLAESERRFRLLAENALDMIYHYRVWPTIGTEYISPAAGTITGYTAEEMMADPTVGVRIVHPDDRELAREMIEHPQRFLVPTVIRYVRPNGEVVHVEHRNTPIFDDHGRVVAIEGIGRDVTDTLAIHDRLRASETQLRRLTASLHSAREAERASLSRELHDELGQSLTSLKIDLTRTVRDLMPLGLAPGLIDRIQSMVGNIDVTTEAVRRLATALRPPALDHLGLAAAIELEGSAFARRTGLRCRTSGSLRTTGLTADQTTAVFRIVQEALTNVARHAGASAVRLIMRQTSENISVKIHDNGRGITDDELDDPSSIGVVGMRERAELIGAHLAITARPGKGTAVLIVVPLTRTRDTERS
jgi:two-component system sensor histidine kinase UhpB